MFPGCILINQVCNQKCAQIVANKVEQKNVMRIKYLCILAKYFKKAREKGIR